MRILNRAEFLKMPAGTVFMNYPDQPADENAENHGYDGVLRIKENTCGENDFVVQELFPWFEGANDSDDFSNILSDMLAGKDSPDVDYDFAGRDGLYDQDGLYAVWSKDDLRALIDRLIQALEA